MKGEGGKGGVEIQFDAEAIRTPSTIEIRCWSFIPRVSHVMGNSLRRPPIYVSDSSSSPGNRRRGGEIFKSWKTVESPFRKNNPTYVMKTARGRNF